MDDHRQTWHPVSPAGRPRRGPGPQRRRRRSLDRDDAVRRAARRAGEPLPPPGRAAGRGLDREGAAALPLARLRLRPARPARRPARSPSTSTTGCRPTRSRRATDGVWVRLPDQRRSPRARSPTCWSRPWSRTASTPSSGWSATPTSASPTRCAGPRSAASCASSASATRAPPPSPRAPTASSPAGRRRASRSPGPGSTNLLTGLYDAKLDGAPVVAISGQVPSKVLGRGAFQDLDLGAVFRDVAISTTTVQAGSDHAELAALAVKHARDGRGVAHLVLPDEVQAQPSERAGRLPRRPLLATAGRPGRGRRWPGRPSWSRAPGAR